MIDYYFEFPEGTKLFDQTIGKYAFLRGYHPDESSTGMKIMHSYCYRISVRTWIENANGLVLAREHGREIHEKCPPKQMTWIKLQAREL